MYAPSPNADPFFTSCSPLALRRDMAECIISPAKSASVRFHTFCISDLYTFHELSAHHGRMIFLRGQKCNFLLTSREETGILFFDFYHNYQIWKKEI